MDKTAWQNWIVQPLRLTWPILALVLAILAWVGYHSAQPCLWHGGTTAKLSQDGVQVATCKDGSSFIDRGGGWEP